MTMVYLATHNSVLALVWVVLLSVLALITVLALTAARSPDADKRKAARKVLRMKASPKAQLSNPLSTKHGAPQQNRQLRMPNEP